MKVVVIGSTGQLGQDLMRTFGDDATGLSHQDLDVTDGVSVASAMHSLRPDWVINTAAFHRVDDCETNSSLAFAVNALGALNVARAAARVKAGVVFISTDYVFGGEIRPPRHPYMESANPQPLNVYGVSKWAGEQLVKQSNPQHIVVRSAGLYGTSTSRKGWTFPELMLNKARAEGVVRVVTDQTLSPTYTHDLAIKIEELVLQAALGLFHIVNAGECSWFEFAKGVFDLAGVRVRTKPVNSDETIRPAPRPSYSALASERLAEIGSTPLRPWKDALRDYLQTKGVI